MSRHAAPWPDDERNLAPLAESADDFELYAERRKRLDKPRPAHASRVVRVGNDRPKPPTMPLEPLPRPVTRRVGWLDARMRGAR